MSVACRPPQRLPLITVRGVARVSFGCVLFAAMAAAGGSAGGCTSSTAVVTYTPITGIVIHSQDLVGPFGCGTANGQVFRYAAVLSYAQPDAGMLELTNIFECFSDGDFENLPTLQTDGGSTFRIAIYAYDFAAYEMAGLPSSLRCAPNQPSDASPCTVSTQALKPSQEGPQRSGLVWRTDCQASQEQGVPVIASCDPLQLLSSPTGSSTDGSSTDTSSPDSAAADAAEGPTNDGMSSTTNDEAGADDGG